MGLDWRYLTMMVRFIGLADVVRGARAMNWRGFNLTIPHKIAVVEHMERFSSAAEAIGSVNYLIDRDGELLGE